MTSDLYTPKLNESWPSYLTVFDNKLYYSSGNAYNSDYELWSYDGINIPSRVANICPGDGNSSPKNLAAINNKLFFSATDCTHGSELWIYDGINDPVMADDIYPGTGSSNPQGFTFFNNKTYFSARNAVNGYELWEYDGINKPQMTADLNTGSGSSNPKNLLVFNNKLYFQADNGMDSVELWEYDGKVAPSMITDFNGDTIPDNLIIYSNVLYFTVKSGNDFGLYEYDGVNKPLKVMNIEGCADPSNFTIYKNKIYFTANNDTVGNELFILCPPVIKTLYESACDSFVLNEQTYKSTGTYTQTLTSIAGCDSIITLNLAILNSSDSTITTVACDSFNLNDQTYENSGIYYQTLTNASGCDSIITLNLTITNSSDSEVNETACDSFMLNGQVYTESGTYTQNLTNAAGCDSLITLNLVINSVDASVEQSENALTAITPNAKYQWLDCNNGYQPLTGETNQSFTAQNSGNYAVMITANDCVDTSACYPVTIVELIENSFENNIMVYPNPISGEFRIQLGVDNLNVTIKITDQSGKIVSSVNSNHNRLIKIHIDEPSGIYFLTIHSKKNKATFKLIKE